MALHPCTSCGRPINPAVRCPHCGAVNPLDDELVRIDQSIREMNLRDMAIVKERSQLASKLQAARFQRDILAHANAERRKQSATTTRTRRVRRRRTVADPPEPPVGTMTDGVTELLDDPPPVEPTVPEPAPTGAPVPAPEASSRSVQNILLALGALLLGVSAVVFAGVAVSSLDALGSAAILAVAAVLALATAPAVARRDLTTTAETVAAVGLTLVPMSGYALRDAGLLGAGPQVFMGIVFALTAVFSFAYAGGVALAVPRYATVLAVQPVPALLAYPLIESPAGWAFVLTLTALIDLAMLVTVIRRGRLVPRWPDTVPSPAPEADDDHGRFESAPEEPDLVVEALAPPRTPWWRRAAEVAAPDPNTPPPSARWLRELTFGLLAAAVAGALLYGTGALLGADATGDAVRSGLLLVLAAATGVAAARLLGNLTLRSVAGAVLTLAVIGAVARIAAVAAPDWTMVATAAAVALAGVAVRFVPDRVRRGPQYASAAVLGVLGVVVGVDVLRAAIAPVRAARPAWQADLAGYPARIAEAAGQLSPHLVSSALLLTLAAALALPRQARHAGAVAGVSLTALAVPASLGLDWSAAPWPLVVAAVGLGAAGLAARERRTAVTHVAAAGIVGMFGAGAALATAALTASVLTAYAGAGVMVAIVARQAPTRIYAWLVGDWAAGAAAFALPGLVAAAGVALHSTDGPSPDTPEATVPVLAASFVAVAVTLAYAAVTQVARREVNAPLTLGTGLGALAVTLAAFRAPGATAADIWVGALLMVAAVLLFFAPAIDTNRRADRMVDGPDVAAAAATVGIIGALARVTALAYPAAALAAAAAVVLIVAVGVRALPADWRRGPVLGAAVGGAVILAAAGWTAISGALRIIALPGPLWRADLSAWQPTADGGGWQAPVALVLLAVAAVAALPRPWSYDTSAVCAVLATVGAPAALGLPWWSPVLLGSAVAIGYGVAGIAARDPRAAVARTAVAGAVLLHAAGAALARPGSTAVALGAVVLVGLLVAVLARTLGPAGTPVTRIDDDVLDMALDDTGMPRHLAQIGGAATAAVLLALPGVFAALAVAQDRTAQVALTAALAASSTGLAGLALIGRRIPQFLPFATVGLVGGATITAIASLPTDHPTALYAAAAALLGVVAEMLRGATRPPGVTVAPEPVWSGGLGTRPRWYAGPRARWTSLRPAGLRGRWAVDPATGAVAVAAIPTVLALVSLAPALRAALVDPFQQLSAIWQGPVPALADPALDGRVDATSALAAVLLTIAAALAALGFGGRPAETVPVILPGLALTLLITPVAVGAAWPATTAAGLAVFTLTMLGLALTPPPVATNAPLLRGTRSAVFVIGLLAGGAGLAGALATRQLTLVTLGCAIGVGLVAAITGRSESARILGWLFAATMGHAFVLTGGYVAGLEPAWSAFGALAVGAVLLVLEATLPRLGRPEHLREAGTVEWSGYASALLALALAYDSPRHLAALLAAWGAVMGLAATRPGRRSRDRRLLFWVAVGLEIGAWWLLMTLSDVQLPEAYTLPFAALALLVGVLEARHREDLSSWAAYGPALLAAFVPTVGIVLTTPDSPVREVLLLVGAVLTLVIGSKLQQQAPVVVGAVVTAIAALHFTVTLVGPWLVLVPLGVALMVLGASNENRRRTQERLRGALTRMR
jgi:hypothetical protein